MEARTMTDPVVAETLGAGEVPASGEAPAPLAVPPGGGPWSATAAGERLRGGAIDDFFVSVVRLPGR
jgi:hypothetical protein